LNNLVWDLDLPKTKAQLLGSRLQQWNLLEKGVKLLLHRKRQVNIASYFLMDDNLLYCNDVCALMEELQLQPGPDQRRLFTDSSKLSLKAVLLLNGNKLPSILLAHAAHIKEIYVSIQYLLKKICYKEQWNICADTEVVALLTGLQEAYTKFCCFLCEWDS
jgi:hypothetical protein